MLLELLRHSTVEQVENDLMFHSCFNELCHFMKEKIHPYVFEIVIIIGVKLLPSLKDDFWFKILRIKEFTEPITRIPWIPLILSEISPKKPNAWKVINLIRILIRKVELLRSNVSVDLAPSLLSTFFAVKEPDLACCTFIIELLSELNDSNMNEEILKGAFPTLQTPTGLTGFGAYWSSILKSHLRKTKSIVNLDDVLIEESLRIPQNHLKFAQITQFHLNLVVHGEGIPFLIEFEMSSIRMIQQNNCDLRFHLVKQPNHTFEEDLKFPKLTIVTMVFRTKTICAQFKKSLEIGCHEITVSTPRKISVTEHLMELCDNETFSSEEEATTKDQQMDKQNNPNYSMFSTASDETGGTTVKGAHVQVSGDMTSTHQKSLQITKSNEDRKTAVLSDIKSPAFVPIGDTQDSSQNEIGNNISGYKRQYDSTERSSSEMMIHSSFSTGNNHNPLLEVENDKEIVEKLHRPERAAEDDIWDFLSEEPLNSNTRSPKYRNSPSKSQVLKQMKDTIPKVIIEHPQIDVTNTIKKLNIGSSLGNIYDQIYEVEGQTSPVLKAQSRANTRAKIKKRPAQITSDTDQEDSDDDPLHSDASYQPSFNPSITTTKTYTKAKRKLRSVVTEVSEDELSELEKRPLKKVLIATVKERLEQKESKKSTVSKLAPSNSTKKKNATSETLNEIFAPKVQSLKKNTKSFPTGSNRAPKAKQSQKNVSTNGKISRLISGKKKTTDIDIVNQKSTEVSEQGSLDENDNIRLTEQYQQVPHQKVALPSTDGSSVRPCLTENEPVTLTGKRGINVLDDDICGVICRDEKAEVLPKVKTPLNVDTQSRNKVRSASARDNQFIKSTTIITTKSTIAPAARLKDKATESRSNNISVYPGNSILSEAYTNQLQNQIFESITNFSNGLISKIRVINSEINRKIVNDLTNKYDVLFKSLNTNFNNDVKEMVELIDDVKDLLHLDEDEIIKYIQEKKFMSQTQ